MRYDSDHKARTRERLLKEASAAIRSEGADRVGVAAIMSRAGLTHGGFYAHFKSKDDLVAEAIGHMFDDRYAAFFGVLDTTDPGKALSAFIDGYLSMTHRNAPDRGCPIPSLASELPRLSEMCRDRFRLGVERLVDGIAGLLDQLGLPDPAALASSVMAELVGAVNIARATNDPGRAEQILAASRNALRHRLGLE